MKLHDKVSYRGIAGLLTVFIFAAIFIYSKFSDNEAPVKIKSEMVDNNVRSEKFFNILDSLKTKIKEFDPGMGSFQDMPSDSIFYEAKDNSKNKVQISGSNNSVGELTWIWNHEYREHLNKETITKFSSVSKMMCGQDGKQWVLKELQKKAAPDKPIMEYATINYNQVQFFNDGLSTVTLKITIL